MSRRILVVDDDAAVRRSLGEALTEEGYDVSVAESAEAGLSRLASLAPDVLLSDIRMPGMDGVELLRLVKQRAPGIDVVLMTAYDDMPTVVRAMREVSGVLDVHDLHIWSLGSSTHALSCHVLIADLPPSESETILRHINQVLGDRFRISHTTLQFEHVNCASCSIPANGARQP